MKKVILLFFVMLLLCGCTQKTKEVTINAIVPPEVIRLPEVFTERANYVYNFSKVNPATSEAEQLPFVATAAGTNVCTDIRYSFTHEDGSRGSEVAVYENGKITFKQVSAAGIYNSLNLSRLHYTVSLK